MVSYFTKRTYAQDGALISQIDGQCLSTDTKPTLNIANGSQMIEMDTSKVYFFDEANSQWREFGGDS